MFILPELFGQHASTGDALHTDIFAKEGVSKTIPRYILHGITYSWKDVASADRWQETHFIPFQRCRRPRKENLSDCGSCSVVISNCAAWGSSRDILSLFAVVQYMVRAKDRTRVFTYKRCQSPSRVYGKCSHVVTCTPQGLDVLMAIQLEMLPSFSYVRYRTAPTIEMGN